MINCIINKTSYICKSSPIKENKILFPVPTNSLCNIKQNDKTNKNKKTEYLKENTNTKHSSEITTSSNQNTKINNTMKIYPHHKSNKNFFHSKDNIIKNIFDNNLSNDKNNIKFFHPSTIRNVKMNQKKSLVFQTINKPLLMLKFKYLNNEENINVFYDDDGLIIAEKVNSIFNLYLNLFELEKLGLMISQYINTFIDLKAKNNDLNKFGVVINLMEIINKCRKKKITAKFNGKCYNYFISNSIDDINEIVEDIFKKINKYNQYKDKDLKDEIKLSILNMMKNKLNENWNYNYNLKNIK